MPLHPTCFVNEIESHHAAILHVLQNSVSQVSRLWTESFSNLIVKNEIYLFLSQLLMPVFAHFLQLRFLSGGTCCWAHSSSWHSLLTQYSDKVTKNQCLIIKVNYLRQRDHQALRLWRVEESSTRNHCDICRSWHQDKLTLIFKIKLSTQSVVYEIL